MIDSEMAYKRIEMLCDCGPRVVGTDGHRKAEALIDDWFAAADVVQDHRFVERFFGKEVECCNFWRTYHGKRPGRVLFGSH